jgi:hypothetical protein
VGAACGSARSARHFRHAHGDRPFALAKNPWLSAANASSLSPRAETLELARSLREAGSIDDVPDLEIKPSR